MLSQSRTTSSRRGNPMVFGTAKLKHGKKHFVAFFYEIRKNRDSQLKIGWTEEKCIAMDKLAQEDHSYRLSHEDFLRYQNHWKITLNKSGKNAPMRLRSDFWTAVTLMIRLHRESGEECAEPIPFQQYQRWHPSSSILQGWIGLKNWWSSIFIFFVVVGSFTADSNLLQPTGGGANKTPHTSPFSRSQCALVMTCHTTWLKRLCASSHPCVMRLSDCLFTLRSSLCSLHCLSLSFTYSWTLTSTFSFFHVDVLVKYTFIKKPLSSKNHFHQKPFSSVTIFIRNHFHQKNETKGWDSQYSPCLCEGVAGRPTMLHMKVCWRSKGRFLGSRSLGFRSLGFRSLGFRCFRV